MTLSLRERLKRGDTLIGTLVTLASPEVAELLSGMGFDWLFIDMEHGPLDVLPVQRILQAIVNECQAVIRVPANDEVWIKRAIDLGCAGIVVPQVNCADDAERAVRTSKYPPEGRRGVGIGRAHRYGFGFAEYVERANRDLAVIVQAEHVDAVGNIASIVAVPGIDAVLIGPYDLSGSMGVPGRVDDPQVRAKIETVRATCQEAGTPLGVFGVTVDAVRPYVDQGYSLIAVGTDALFMGAAAKQALTALRDRSTATP
jgi:2-dehydro-3-deoxyglucarate aldolase/4-hydroxy-2-oxoheptanedioate aldolase